jgi:hypothetical protein
LFEVLIGYVRNRLGADFLSVKHQNLYFMILPECNVRIASTGLGEVAGCSEDRLGGIGG